MVAFYRELGPSPFDMAWTYCQVGYGIFNSETKNQIGFTNKMNGTSNS